MHVAIAKDRETTKLHFSQEKEVWLADGDKPAENTGLSVDDFLVSEYSDKLLKVRLPGTRHNADLICKLHHRKVSKDFALNSVQLCSPQICKSQARRNVPEKMLFDMRRNTNFAAASMGGWHETTSADFYSYAMAGAVDRDDSKDIQMVFNKHPAAKALTFITHLDVPSVCRVLSYILDPRWFMDGETPDRLHRLYRFFGIDEKTQAGVAGEGPKQKLHDRCKLVTDCWKTTPSADNRYPTFIWRAWVMARDALRGDLRANQKFLDYLFWTWTAFYAEQSGRCGEPMFVPEYFFESTKDVEGYRRHMQLKV